MDDSSYRLYVGNQQFYFETFDAAKNAAAEYIEDLPELRIEVLVETEGADFWAYEYQTHQWLPS